MIHLKCRFATGTVWLDGKMLPLSPSLALINHSPDGFMWGYGGSGPAQLALAILYEITGNAEFSKAMHHHFKEDFIATLPQADIDMVFDLAGWIQEAWRRFNR
jgi:hypothetical protein